MDTHLHPNPSRAAPGEDTASHIDLPERAAAPAAVSDGAALDRTATHRPARLRTWLLAGTAAVGVLGLIGTGIVYSLSGTGAPAHRGTDWVGMPQAVSPQRQPGQTSEPAPGASTGARQPTPGPALNASRPADAARLADAQFGPASVPKTGADDLRALKQSGPAILATPRPLAAATASPASAPREASATPSATTQADTAADPQVPAVAAVSAPATTPAKPADTRPAPQGPLDVIGRVTELADEISQERREDAELRHQLAQLLVDTDTRFSEFERRLSQAEIGTTPNRARAVPERTPATFAPPAIPVEMSSAGRMAAPAAARPGARRYEIRAASPGVAVLGTLDGTPTVIEIGIGNQVPGYGRVNAIVQKGNAWAVQCERGIIQ